MMDFLKRLTTVHYDNQIERQRAIALIHFSLIVIVISVLAVLFLVIPRFPEDPTGQTRSAIIAALAVSLSFVTIRLARHGQLQIGSIIAVSIGMAGSVAVIANRGMGDPTVMSLTIPATIAGLLLDRRGILGTAGVILLLSAVLALSEFGSITPLFEIDMIVLGVIIMLVPVLFLVLGSGMLLLFERYQIQFNRLKTVGEFNIKPDALSESTILYNAMNMIRDRLGYDFAQIYMVDPPGVITRRLRAGEGAVFTEARVNEASALQSAVRERKPIILNLDDPHIIRSHFQPASRYGAVIPVMIGSTVVALLDVQDDNEAFNTDETVPLQSLAGRLARALHDARELSLLYERINDDEAALKKMRSQIATLKQRSQDTALDVWDEYMQQRGAAVFGFDSKDNAIIPANDLPEALQKAVLQDGIHIEVKDRVQVVTVPIILRGEILGAMAFDVPITTAITDRHRTVLRIVTNRLAQALDNKRLFEQNETRATRERTANEIAALLIGATDLDSVLSLAATNFNEVLGAVSTRIHLQPMATSSTNQS